MANARGRWPWVLLGFVLILPAAIFGFQGLLAGKTSVPPRPTLTSPPTPASTQMVDGFPAPATYWQACFFEATVCNPNDPTLPSPQSPLPAALRRPIQLPALQGGRCPITPANNVNTGDFGGSALGAGPVRLLSSAIVDLDQLPSPLGWDSPNEMTIWFSEPQYQGPWIVRGHQLDGPNLVIFGNPPALTASLVVPPIPTINTDAGYRSVPTGILVHEPGCYALQIDGLTFSDHIVFEAVLAGKGHQ